MNERKRPARRVWNLPAADGRLVVFVTACTKRRVRCLDTEEAHEKLRTAWGRASAWQVHRYVIMPDHVHLLVSPLDAAADLQCWVRYWKSLFTRSWGRPGFSWLPGCWDRRLRTDESLNQKWAYVLKNPERHGLVKRSEDWLYQGTMDP